MLKPSLPALALAAACVAAHAQTVTEQPEVVVTASRVATTVDAALADVSVITRADIEASGAPDLYDLLRMQAGVDIARAGGPGQQAAVFLRGTNSNHVLVLVDGVRVASANTGGLDWSQLPLHAIERVEIVRGPRASYWGSDAIGGVIQIFTRKLDGPRAAVQYGSYRDAAGSAGIGRWGEQGGFSVQAGLRHVGGFSAQNPQGFSFNPDDDGYRSRNLAARGAYRLGAQTLSATLLRNDSDNAFDQGRTHVVEQSAGVGLDGALAEGWTHRLSLGLAHDSLLTPDFFSLLKSHRESLTWQNTFALGAQQRLIAGLEYVEEHGESRDTFAGSTLYADSRHNAAAFTGWQGGAGRLDWELAARRDQNSEFGGATTGSAALGLRLADWARVTGSWGRAFRGPNLNEQFSPGYGGLFAGNPALKPERSRSGELALELTPTPALRAKLAAYRTDVSDLIDFTGPAFRAENTARARIDGVEADLDWHAGAWAASANATWQDPRDARTDAPLLRRPRHKGNLLLTRTFGERLDAGVELVAAGPSPDFGGDLPGYAIVNARLGITLAPAWHLQLRAENLADRDYALIRGYNTPGRSGWIELVWQP
ncbi:MAG: TonB-dependent receptor [Mizugakiibacter sp.]|uniref:TonB-dependent receptor plug domain-containing protein n=1 Tax=Mizugakiibacter sp. TaxID=1972610 RepID=UPI0031C14085|nr:TonB-dependent receptor [Xanthomonadaceae bacterium]